MSIIENVRAQKPVRYRKSRSDGTVETLIASIGKERGLPDGCIKIVAPNGRKMRKDATVKALKARWQE